MKKTISLLTSALLLLSILQFPSTAVAGAQPAATGQFGILGSIGGPTSAVAVSGGYAFVGKGSSIIVLACAGGRLTQKGKQLNLPSFVSDLKVSGTMLYAACGSAGLHIIDIQDPLNPRELGTYATKGFAEAVAVAGTTAYLANGNEGLQIIDISDPTSPRELGQAYKGKYTFGVAISGSKAYIAAADDGLLVADVSDRTAPVELAACDTPGVARNIAVSGKYAYVADDWKGVAVADISNPASPVLFRSINTAGRAYGVAVDKNFLYVADAYMGLRVFDVANPASPKDLTSFIPADSQLLRVVVNGGYAYCADRTNGIFCFNVSKPSSLALTGLYSHTLPLPLNLSSELISWDNADAIARLMVLGIVTGKVEPDRTITRAEFAALLCQSLRTASVPAGKKPTFKDVPASHRAYKYVETVVRLGLMKGKDKTHFSPDGSLSYGEVVTSLLKLVNAPAAITASTSAGIKEAERLGLPSALCRYDMKSSMNRANAFALLSKVLIEIPDGKTKQTLLQSKFGITFTATPLQISDIAVKGTYAYSASGKSGLSVVDVSNPANPKQVAHLDFTNPINYVEVHGQYVYALSSNTVNVIDVADPLHPVTVLTRSDNMGGPVRGLDIDSGKLYIADEWGYKVYSLSDPGKLPLLCSHSFFDDVRNFRTATSDIAVRNGIAYIPKEQDGVKIYDVSSTAEYTLISTYSTNTDGHPRFYTNVEFRGNIAYVSCSDTVELLDISDIRAPRLISTYTDLHSSQFNYRMGFYQNLALFPNDRNGLQIADVSDPSNIRKVADADTSGIPINVRVAGDFAYISDGIGGMGIMKLSGAATSVPPTSPDAVKAGAALPNLQMSLFKGPDAENCMLSTEKTLARLNIAKSVFSQTLTVTNTEDSGAGSLRWCLENIKQGGRILFDTNVFAPSDPAVIYTNDALQFFTGNITLDASNAGVVLDGSRMQGQASAIMVTTNGNVIRGVKVCNYTGHAMDIFSGSNVIGGSRQKGNAPIGEGNVFIKTGGLWITGQNAADNIFVGNNVGVDSDGMTPQGNLSGIALRGTGCTRNVIGIDLPEYRNIVSDCSDRGISMMEYTYGNLIEGNYVGTDITGTKAIGNYQNGISCEIGGYANIIKNNVACAGKTNGILLWDNGVNFNVVISNSIGIGADGVTNLPNEGVQLPIGGGVGGGCGYNVIGGAQPDMQNRIFEGRTVVPGQGVYDTVVNGKVYKYADQSGY